MKLKNIFVGALCTIILFGNLNYVSACKLPNGNEIWWLETYGGMNWLKTKEGENWLGTNDGISWLQTENGLRWLENNENELNKIFEISMYQDTDEETLYYYLSEYYLERNEGKCGFCTIT